MAIHAALKGNTFITPALAADVIQDMQHAARSANEPKDTVTQRQREILKLLAEGRSAKEIAQALSISARTVEFHKYQIMETHGLHNSAELVHFAIKKGIVTI
jgi:DNA-binding NarL/FixJ family response regulator